jgi:hypothetical protein
VYDFPTEGKPILALASEIVHTTSPSIANYRKHDPISSSELCKTEQLLKLLVKGRSECEHQCGQQRFAHDPSWQIKPSYQPRVSGFFPWFGGLDKAGGAPVRVIRAGTFDPNRVFYPSPQDTVSWLHRGENYLGQSQTCC